MPTCFEYTIRKGWAGALLGRASGGYSLSTGVVLFAAALAGGEAIRHLPEVAERQGVDLQTVRAAWNSLIVPNVRFVKLRDDAVSEHDGRIQQRPATDTPRHLRVVGGDSPDPAAQASNLEGRQRGSRRRTF